MPSRRDFVKLVGAVGATSLLQACASQPGTGPGAAATGSGAAAAVPSATAAAGLSEDLVAAAKKDGEVSFYTTGGPESRNGLATAFTAKYGIPVNIVTANSVLLLQRIQTEIAAGRLGGDVLDIPDSLAVAADIGALLMPYDPPSRARIPEKYKRPNYTQHRLYAGAIAWNTNRVKAADAPKDWPDLADPKWKGRLGFGDPTRTNSMVQWTDMVTNLYGADFLKRLGLNRPIVYETQVTVTSKIVAGEVDAGLVFDYAIKQQKALGAPYDGVIPDNTYVSGACIGVFKSATHVNAAKLFVDFAVSAEGNAAYTNPILTTPANPEANTRGAFSASDYKKPYDFGDFTDLTKRTPRILADFDAAFRRTG